MDTTQISIKNINETATYVDIQLARKESYKFKKFIENITNNYFLTTQLFLTRCKI
jgi:flagellar motor switch protein FliM